MDTQQLKMLAVRLRAMLADSEHLVGHNQALDLIAALPGLRNWPEVQSFPDRVAACALDLESTGRLANRLKRKLSLGLSARDVLGALDPQASGGSLPHVWPSGPVAGLYVTTDLEHITALLGLYEDATDGGLVYAERAANAWPASIDLGDYGLWSEGLDRVPSGTLIVIGPLSLAQDEWQGSRERLQQAANLVLNNGHRVAVVVTTPSLSTIYQDLWTLLKPREPHDDFHTALRGVVAADGGLRIQVPFSPPPGPLHVTQVQSTAEAIPSYVRAPILEAMARHTKQGRPTGLLLLGTTDVEGEHPGIDLAQAALAMTEHGGPAARVMPRARSTPAKDWIVPDDIKRLPFLPSVEAAYEQGYRRILYQGGFSRSEEVLPYAEDALLISWTYADSIATAFMRSVTEVPRGGDTAMALERVIAILVLTQLRTDAGVLSASDLYVDRGMRPTAFRGVREAYEFFEERRLIRWEDEMDRLLETGALTPQMLRSEFPRQRAVHQYLNTKNA